MPPRSALVENYMNIVVLTSNIAEVVAKGVLRAEKIRNSGAIYLMLAQVITFTRNSSVSDGSALALGPVIV